MSGVKASEAPNKAEREVCWTARDKYWECLDSYGAATVDKKLCQELRKAFESGCSRTWVKHFDRRFGYTRFNKYSPKEVVEEDKNS